MNQDQTKITVFQQALNASWETYYQTLNQLPSEYQLSSCLQLLDIADTLLNQNEGLDNAKIFQIFLIGGIQDQQTRKHYPFDVQLMGDMQSFASFKKLLRSDTNGISQLLKIIPSAGPIDGWHYMQFIDSYQQLFANNGFRQAPLFPATRLLTMKRPDQFVAIDPTTMPLLCQAFSIKNIKNQDFQRYWDEIIMSLKKSDWFNADMPMDASQLALYRARVALVDRLVCTPSEIIINNLNFADAGVVSEQGVTHSQPSASIEFSQRNNGFTYPSENASPSDPVKSQIKKVVKQPKKLTIAPLKSVKGNRNAATKLMSQYYFANKAKFAKIDISSSRETIIEKLIEGHSVEQAFDDILASSLKK